ncbi:uncharacterized protein B0H18DRAFT_1003087 [Fomitopsis serialis]|uniref:uncharacterized protein n=1 Tax=Fomitopsis serialis TaxID=139415 RepID=UPI0020077EAA|nr:uncharacterized protein B0H18DRAFT_1003087 [Neoantrodia serialis]KAH9927660.1 hypothetical protein B0H18DRAFT_1003087 [Neoantrodia serialis]
MRASISSLPAEVVEIILVNAASGGFPSAIGALSQTCRAFHTLIYDAADHHLWRAIFLSTFDDPRRLAYYDFNGFDWCGQFRERIWAASFLKRHVRPLRVQKIYTLRSRTTATSVVDLTPTYDTNSSLRMLNALLSVIKSTAPDEHGHYLPNQDVRRTDPVEWEGIMHKRSLSYAYQNTPDFAERLRGYSESLNVPWLRSVLERGLPAPLITKISANSRDSLWDSTPESLALGELIACAGFIPVRNLIEERTSRLASSSSGHSRTEPHPSGVSDMDMSADAQRLRAHHRARELVYRMGYLSRRRHWGPYLPVAPTTEDEPVLKDNIPNQGGPPRELRQMFLRELSDSESASDPDYFPDNGDTTSSHSVDASDDDDGEPPLVEPPVQSRKRKRVIPSAEQLNPDWAWLAAARILVQSNFDDLENFRIADFLDWNMWREVWVNRAHLDQLCFVHGDESRDDADSQAKVISEGSRDNQHYRDWAGVQGVWRRAVLWLDYADLQREYNLCQEP